MAAEMMEKLMDPPKGALSEARSKASFSLRQMKHFIESEESMRAKIDIWSRMEKDPIFARTAESLRIEEVRERVEKQVQRLLEQGVVPPFDMSQDLKKLMGVIEAINQYDSGLMLRYCIRHSFFFSSLQSLGTEKHEKIKKQAHNSEIVGCYCMTEIGHGSNTKQCGTVATFDPQTQEFIMNTPDFQSAKCWAGLLGKSATHATVFAQLYTPDGKCHGLHAFCFPIRDTLTLQTLPGVIAGDMGAKGGLNAVDNGFMMFKNYRVPRDSLLDRNGSVNKDGNYGSPFKDAMSRFYSSLGSLIFARSGINIVSTSCLNKAITIAIRYSAVRKQFSPANSEPEQPVINYQIQQWRLIPYLASAYVLNVIKEYIFVNVNETNLKMGSESSRPETGDWKVEAHAITSSSKVFSTATAQDAIQVCREACGGFGYLRAAGLCTLRDDNDANVTLEGANDVLIQQAANWLMALWARKETHQGKTFVKFSSPLGSVKFLDDITKVISSKFVYRTVQELMQPQAYLEMFEWLICHLMKSTEAQIKKHFKGNMFNARNNAQVYYARNLSLAYIQSCSVNNSCNCDTTRVLGCCMLSPLCGLDSHQQPNEHYCIKVFLERLNNAPISLRPVLHKLCALFALHHLESNLVSFYEGNYAANTNMTSLVRDAVLQLCCELQPESVTLVDAIAPPDFVLDSVLGVSSGEIYTSLENSFYTSPETFERPSWWLHLRPKL